jgi:hypothetical protein
VINVGSKAVLVGLLTILILGVIPTPLRIPVTIGEETFFVRKTFGTLLHEDFEDRIVDNWSLGYG